MFETKKSKKPGDKKGTARIRNKKKVEKKVDDTLFKQPKKSIDKCTATLSGSDARLEQSLVNRMQRIEKDISWKEGQRNDVARALKKQRQQMLKRGEDQPSRNRGDGHAF